MRGPMLKKIGIGLGAVVAILLVVVALQPAEFRIERSTDIEASAAVVFPYVSDFHAWDGWSPWAKLDPAMKKTFSGAPSGKGSVYAWSGNDQVGSGRMEIVALRENAEVTIKLDFLTPMETTNTTVFKLVPQGAGVRVNWAMTGENNFMGKAFGLVMDMDEMVGADFEKGLAELKRQAESKAEAAR